MKITKTQLKQIIKEELEKVAGLEESNPGEYYARKRRKAAELFDKVKAKEKEIADMPDGPEKDKAEEELSDLKDRLDMARYTGD